MHAVGMKKNLRKLQIAIIKCESCSNKHEELPNINIHTRLNMSEKRLS